MEMEFSQADFNCLLVAEHTRKTSEVNYAKDPLMLRYNHGAYFFLPSYVMRTHGAKQQCQTVKRTLRKQLELVFEQKDSLRYGGAYFGFLFRCFGFSGG
ncbi:hypothetical protein V6Z12_A05G348400 [Gossypium hirsutum]